jgi:hypothetical protein
MERQDVQDLKAIAVIVVRLGLQVRQLWSTILAWSEPQANPARRVPTENTVIRGAVVLLGRRGRLANREQLEPEALQGNLGSMGRRENQGCPGGTR